MFFLGINNMRNFNKSKHKAGKNRAASEFVLAGTWDSPGAIIE